MNIALKEGAKAPEYANEFAAGFDLFTMKDEIIRPGETKLIDTGVYFEIPENYYIQLEEKSGIALKTGLILKAGKIDPDFRDSVKVVYYNSGDTPAVFIKGQKLVQGEIRQRNLVDNFSVIPKEDLSETKRGLGGFGSTGNF